MGKRRRKIPMKCIDTNYLVRLTLLDVPEQVRIAEQALHTQPLKSVIVTESVVEEYCFVLGSPRTYGFTHTEIHEGLTLLLSKKCFAVSLDILRALDLFRDNPKLDFVDCLLAVRSGMKKQNILTFDKDLLAVLK